MQWQPYNVKHLNRWDHSQCLDEKDEVELHLGFLLLFVCDKKSFTCVYRVRHRWTWRNNCFSFSFFLFYLQFTWNENDCGSVAVAPCYMTSKRFRRFTSSTNHEIWNKREKKKAFIINLMINERMFRSNYSALLCMHININIATSLLPS